MRHTVSMASFLLSSGDVTAILGTNRVGLMRLRRARKLAFNRVGSFYAFPVSGLFEFVTKELARPRRPRFLKQLAGGPQSAA